MVRTPENVDQFLGPIDLTPRPRRDAFDDEFTDPMDKEDNRSLDEASRTTTDELPVSSPLRNSSETVTGHSTSGREGSAGCQ